MTNTDLRLPDWYDFEVEHCHDVHEGEEGGFNGKARSYQGLIKNTPGCSTSACNALSQQLIHQMNVMNPNILVSFDDLNVKLKKAAFPYLQAPAKAALARAIQERGKTLTVNSGYRTIAQQLLLFNWGRSCGYPVVAPPGRSNHQSGLALDINDHNGWKPYLQKHGGDGLSLAPNLTLIMSVLELKTFARRRCKPFSNYGITIILLKS